MKRYTLPELLSGAKNGTVTLDGEYVLYSDLIAAGCLVPVPDGGICKQCKGQGSYVVPVYGAYGDDRYRTDRTDCELCKATGLSIRLVPLAELEGES